MESLNTYIGDGVYAQYSGYDICLYTDRVEGRVEIYLGCDELQALKEFEKRIIEYNKSLYPSPK